MDELGEILGTHNRVEDVQWLCSLSEPELDLLISLKRLALERAKVVGHPELAMKVDLRVLRVLGLALMEYLKGKSMGLPQVQVSGQLHSLIDDCKLSKHDLVDAFSMDELKSYLGTGKSKRGVKRGHDDISCNEEQ